MEGEGGGGKRVCTHHRPSSNSTSSLCNGISLAVALVGGMCGGVKSAAKSSKPSPYKSSTRTSVDSRVDRGDSLSADLLACSGSSKALCKQKRGVPPSSVESNVFNSITSSGVTRGK